MIDGQPNSNEGKGGRNRSQTNGRQGNLLEGIDNKTIRSSKSDVDNLLLRDLLLPFTTDRTKPDQCKCQYQLINYPEGHPFKHHINPTSERDHS